MFDEERKFKTVRVLSVRKASAENDAVLKERGKQDKEAERHRMMQKALAAEAAQLKREIANKKPYDDFRDLPPIALAEHILKDQRILETVRGIQYVRGQVARPWLKIREANRVLKAMNLPQIIGDASWLV